LAAKPEQGSYTLEFKVVPSDAAKFVAIDNSVVTVKILDTVTVVDAQVILSDSSHSEDIAEGHKYRVSFPRTLDETITVNQVNHVYVTFSLKNQVSGNAVRPHQVFLKLTRVATGQESVVVAPFVDKQYLAHFSFPDVVLQQFYGQSGAYSLELIVGDAFISNPFSWKLANLDVKFQKSDLQTPSNPFGQQPDIEHKFRKPDDRPRESVSTAFTGAVAVPVLVLLIGLLRTGANLSNFPTGGSAFLYAVGFQGCFGAILFLFVMFWLKFNMIETLLYLGGISLPTLFFAHKALNYFTPKAKSE